MKNTIRKLLPLLLCVAMFVALFTVTAFAAETAGSAREVDGTWYFYEADGTLTTTKGWHDDASGKRYYANADGTLVNGWFELKGNKYYLSPSLIRGQAYEVDGTKYFFKGDGVLAKTAGWYDASDGYRYYANASGEVQEGWLELDGNKYYLTPAMVNNGIRQIDGTYYFFEASGALTKTAGWKTDKDGLRYFTNNNGTLVTEWYDENGERYYLDPNMVTGAYQVDGVWFLFNDKTGALVREEGWASHAGTDAKGNAKTVWSYVEKVDHHLHTGWLELDGKRYHINHEDACRYDEGPQAIDGSWYYFNKDGVMSTSGGWIVHTDGSKYYANSDGTLHTGWIVISGKHYYMDPAMYADRFATISNKEYYFDADGVMAASQWISWQVKGQSATYWSYAKADGSLAEGWLQVGNNWYYLVPTSYDVPITRTKDGSAVAKLPHPFLLSDGTFLIDGQKNSFDSDGIWLPNGPTTGWYYTTSGNWVYYDAEGNPLTGPQTIDGYEYYFDQNGIMQTGWVARGSYWYYYYGSGAMAKGTWLLDGGAWYYLQDDGIMVTGRNYIQGINYCMQPSGAMAANSWAYDWNTNYWYYARANGALAYGWQQVGGPWYYLDPVDGHMHTGWEFLDGEWYYLDTYGSGHMVTGWRYIEADDAWYYFNTNGTMATGWVKTANGTYYCYSNGKMAKNVTLTIDGKQEVFDSDGLWTGTKK